MTLFCETHWAELGLTMSFHQWFERYPECPATAEFTDAVIEQRRWRTDRGLRVGDPVARLRRLYPNARWRRSGGSYSYATVRPGWWLLVRMTRSDCAGPGPMIPTLLARTRGGVVSALEVRRRVFLCD